MSKDTKTAEEILNEYEPNSEYPSYYHESDVLKAMEAYATQLPKEAEQKDPTLILSKCERTFGALDKIITTLKEAQPHQLKRLVESIDIDLKDAQKQVQNFIYTQD
jgi:hypothetical protein